MSDQTTHYFPDALAIFVPAFVDSPKNDTAEAVLARTFRGRNIQEIAALRISLTVSGSPGTFAMTLVNKDGRFFVPDNASLEVPALYNFSARSSGDVDIADLKIPYAGANYYPFQAVQNWADFSSASITESDGTPGVNTYTVQYRRDYSGRIVERWAFDTQGGIIKLVSSGDFAAEKAFQDAPQDAEVWYDVFYPHGLTQSTPFILHKITNDAFFARYQTPEQQVGGGGPRVYRKGTLSISPMDRVVIYVSKRFDVEGNILQTPAPVLERAFTGVVNTVQDGYSAGAETVEIQGEDVTKYLRISLVNPTPTIPANEATSNSVAIFQSKFDPRPVGDNADLFKGRSGPEIVKMLLFGENNSPQDLASRASYLRGVGQYVMQSSPDRGGDGVIDAVTGAYTPLITSKGKQRQKGESIIDISSLLGTLFQPSSVHIIDPFATVAGEGRIDGYRPYEISFRFNNSLYTAEFKTRRDIIYTVARDMHFAFFADRYGEIWLRPPYFDNAHILTAPFPQYYVLDDQSVISFGNVEDDSHVFTGVQVSTEPQFNEAVDTESAPYTGGFRDDVLQAKYGERLLIDTNPLIRTGAADIKATRPVLELYAKSLLQRTNAELRSGQVQMQLRIELDPGRPVYLPARNMIFYAETVEHAIVWGQSATTTVHVTYGRKPWEIIPELLQFAKNDSTNHTKIKSAAPKDPPFGPLQSGYKPVSTTTVIDAP